MNYFKAQRCKMEGYYRGLSDYEELKKHRVPLSRVMRRVWLG
jgi:hypothetical protein